MAKKYIISIEDAYKKNMKLDSNEVVILSEGTYLLPWTNGFYKVDENDSSGLGWHDSRILYPKKDIQIYDNFYVIGTNLARTIDVKDLLFHKDSKKGIKNNEEMMEYLSKKEPRAHKMSFGDRSNIYTTSFGDFIVSISPTHYICFDENLEQFAKESSKNFHSTIEDILAGINPSLRRNMNFDPRKN